MDYLIHFLLEATGSLIALFAYRNHHCNTWWHRGLIWIMLTALTTVVTVQTVG
jgi:hypothetical protein